MSLIKLTEYEHWTIADDLYSSSKARGTFNPLHFLVHLREHDHTLLQRVTDQILSENTDDALINAFSIYFHETIHWWQHVGSTLGFMLSLKHPAQLHVNRKHLHELLEQIGPRKPLVAVHRRAAKLSSKAQRTLNIIMNNWHDTEFNACLLIEPKCCHTLQKSMYFESVGHSLQIGLTHALWLLGATLQGGDVFLPDIRQWETAFALLRQNKVEGFHRTSPGTVTSIGARQIFEGQARFSQLQYLHLVSGGSVGWDDFRSAEMLSDVYVDAFRVFLKLTGLRSPASVVDPTVLLFLLVCDIATNPGDGYPFEIRSHEALIELIHPGHRFVVLCNYIAKHPKLVGALDTVNRNRYIEVSDEICDGVGMHSTREIFERIASWGSTVRQVKELQREEAAFEFVNANLPARLWFAKHLRFAQSRLQRPEFFCWPALHFATNSIVDADLQVSSALWEEHAPLFLANFGGDIQPRLPRGIDEKNVYQTAADFFAWQLLYDLTRQWMIKKGPFDLDFRWINRIYTADVVKSFVEDRFADAFGVSIDDFRFVKSKKAKRQRPTS